MEAAMTRRRRTDPRPSLDASFEPRRRDQDVLADAYQRLLPPLSRLLCLTPRTQQREEASDAQPRVNLDPDVSYAGNWVTG
jgi:hypothetical protein